MELIIKIGADQQGLANTVRGMTESFKHANISMPVSWGTPGTTRGAIMQTSGQRAYLAQQEADAAGSLAGQTMGTAVKRGTSLLKGMLIAQLTSLAAESLDILGTKFWEHVYGADEGTINRIKEAHARIAKAMLDFRSAKADFEDRLHELTIKHASPEQRVKILKADLGGAQSEEAEAKKKFDDAKELSDGLISGAVTIGPQKRKAEKWERQKAVFDSADKQADYTRARIKTMEVEDRYKQELDSSISTNKKDKGDKGFLKQGFLKHDEKQDLGNDLFQADAMAQAGLFTGSALLMDPSGHRAMTQELQGGKDDAATQSAQEQLSALKTIAANTTEIAAKRSMFEP